MDSFASSILEGQSVTRGKYEAELKIGNVVKTSCQQLQ